MRRLVVALALVAAFARPAAAYVDTGGSDSSSPTPSPTATPAPTASPTSTFVPPPGVYLVTDVYAGDVTTQSGNLTTYTTLTQPATTEVYAKVLDVVGTGEPSPYDGLSFNDRATLPDGELVAGTYYQDYVLDGGMLIPVNIVFYQDDSAVLAWSSPTPAPIAGATPAPYDGSGATPIPTGGPIPDPSSTPAPTLAPLPSVIVGLDPIGGPRLLRSLEVARGELYRFRVNVAGSPTDVVLDAWELVAGVDDAATLGVWHAASDPLYGLWVDLAPPGEPWTLTLRVRVTVVEPEARTFTATGRVDIWVRAPAVSE